MLRCVSPPLEMACKIDCSKIVFKPNFIFFVPKPRVQFSGSYSPSHGICSLEGGAPNAPIAPLRRNPAQDNQQLDAMRVSSTIQLKWTETQLCQTHCQTIPADHTKYFESISNRAKQPCVLYLRHWSRVGVPNSSPTKIIVWHLMQHTLIHSPTSPTTIEMSKQIAKWMIFCQKCELGTSLASEIRELVW